MTNCSHVNYINQRKQIHIGNHTYHMSNILSSLIIMLGFLVIMNITTFDLVMMDTFSRFTLLVYFRY